MYSGALSNNGDSLIARPAQENGTDSATNLATTFSLSCHESEAVELLEYSDVFKQLNILAGNLKWQDFQA